MRIHTNELNYGDLAVAAAVANVTVEHFSRHGSRKSNRAFEVALSGSSPYAGASTKVEWPYKAATWDEWGVFLYELFKVEPGLVAGQYNGVEDFERQTREIVEHVQRYFPENHRNRRTHTGPWLTA